MTATRTPPSDDTPGGTPTARAQGDLSGHLALTRSNELVVRDLTTGDERTIATADGANYLIDPHWSPDGTKVAYALQITLDPAVDNDFGSDLYLVDRDGQNRRLVMEHEAPGDFLRFPSFSPDGATLYFSRSRVDESTGSPNPVFEIAALDLASGGIRVIAGKAYGGEVAHDGKHYVYVDLDGGGQRLAVLDLATGAKTILVTPADGLALYYAPRFSPDDRRIAFAGSGDIGNIPSVFTPAPRRPEAAGGGGGLRGAVEDWLFGATAEADGPPWDIYIVHIDGDTNLRRLTEVYDDQPYPAWSADGESLVYVGITGLVYISADRTREPKKLADGLLHAQLDWTVR